MVSSPMQGVIGGILHFLDLPNILINRSDSLSRVASDSGCGSLADGSCLAAFWVVEVNLNGDFG
jgi:hypothetical protein